MTADGRSLILGILLNGAGHHEAGWRLPGSRAEEIYSFDLYRDFADLAEEAKLNYLFIADSPSQSEDQLATRAFRHFEPITLLSALAVTTRRIGLIGTFSTTFNEPYNLARKLASLDILSKGRAGWNIVTSHSGAENFGGAPLPPHEHRYRRAHEFVTVAEALWRGWDEDAVVADRNTGRWVDTDLVHPANHSGEFFTVRGPLNLPRSPQTRPVYAQAGSSEPGRELGARFGEIIYTPQLELGEAQRFYADVKGRAARYGRDPSDLRIVPGVSPIIGRTTAEAHEIRESLNALVDYSQAKRHLARGLNLDIDDIDLDERIPAERFPSDPDYLASSGRSRFRRLAVDEGLTVRQLITIRDQGNHWSPAGTAEQVADALIARFDAHGADGYNFLPLYNPDGFAAITQQLVPVLIARGYFRPDYQGETLRDDLGFAPLT